MENGAKGAYFVCQPFAMFENTFKNIDDILYKDAGADSELDYIGQTSWVLFLRHFGLAAGQHVLVS